MSPATLTCERSGPTSKLRSRVVDAQNVKHRCTVCGKCFDRGDSLKRHHQIHNSQHQQKKTRRKACLSCVRSKTKCSEDYPACERCEKKRLICLYTIDKRQLHRRNTITEYNSNCGGAGTDLGHEREFSRGFGGIEDGCNPSNDDVSLLNIGYLDEDVMAGRRLHTSEPVAAFTGAAPHLSPWPQAAFSQFIGVGDFYPTLLSPSAWEGVLEQTISDLHTNPTATTDTMQNAAEFATSPDFVLDAGGTAVSYVPQPPSSALLSPPDLSTDIQTQQRLQSSKGNTANGITEASLGRVIMTATTMEPEPGPKNSLPALVDNLDRNRSGYPRRFFLPSVDPATQDDLLTCLRLPLTRNPWQSMSLTAFPSGQQMDYFLDLYFGHFDMLLPMIHRPTFNPSADLVLTLSMCAIGVLYSGLDGAKAFAQSLSELLRRLLIFMNEQNASTSRSYGALAAQTLQSILGNSLGSRRLFEFGDNNRGLLVANVRAMGLFARHESTTPYEGLGLQERWELWIRKERMCRLAWCIYTFDASATYYRNCRPHLSLAELKLDLPCSRDSWEADSAYTWTSLQPWAHGDPPLSPSFRETLGRLFEDTGTPSSIEPRMTISASVKITDGFHRTLMSTTMLRMVWDLRESSCGPTLPALMGASLLKPAFTQEMGVVLSILRQLTTSALNDAAARTPFQESRVRGKDAGLDHTHSLADQDFRGLVLRARISLVAQIIATDRISDHLDAEWPRGRVAEMSKVHEVAERNLRSWAVMHSSEPRRMAHVGAQLLAISRLYPCHLPREPYDTCRAGLLLWTMVPFIRVAEAPPLSQQESIIDKRIWPPQQQNDSEWHERGQRVCQLDWLGSDDAKEAQTIRDWIDYGGDDFVLRIYGIPDICTSQGRRQILEHTSDLLRKQHVWGASDTYRDIVLQALGEGLEQ